MKHIKIYEGFVVVNGVFTAAEKEKITGLTMLQTEQLVDVFNRYNIPHEVVED